VGDFVDADHPCISKKHNYPTGKSDFIRLALLQKYGGIYMDATVFVTEPLDWIIGDGVGYSYFQAFVNQKNMNLTCQTPVVETSFLAAPPNHPFVNAWLDELSTLENCQHHVIDEYVKTIPFQKNLSPHYHFAYHALTKVLLRKPLKQFPNMFLINNSNFMNFIVNGNVQVLTQDKQTNYSRVLKLISSERKLLDDILKQDKIHPNSFIRMIQNQSGVFI
jgi:hypothetical protein